MVKTSRVLDEATKDAADVRYEDTRLAKRAPAARRRLVGILAVGALALAIEAFVSSWAWALLAFAVAAIAVALRAQRLGGLIAAGLASALAAFLPIAFFALLPRTPPTTIALAVSFVLGAAALPDVLVLVRDAELQNTYGRWAKRADSGVR